MTIEDRVKTEIDVRFTYIRYPDELNEDVWQQEDGVLIYMGDMDLDHLKNSIGKVENSIIAFKKHYEKDANKIEISNILLPLVEKKLKELKEMYEYKK